MTRNAVELSPIWKNFYDKTCKENKEILKEILEMSKSKRVLFIIPPIFTEVINDDDMYFFKQMKKYFLKAVGQLRLKYEFEVFDFSEKIKETAYFFDYTHLNDKGCLMFTSMINKICS